MRTAPPTSVEIVSPIGGDGRRGSTGSSSVSPVATVRMASASRPGGASFRRNPNAPRERPRWAHSSRPACRLPPSRWCCTPTEKLAAKRAARSSAACWPTARARPLDLAHPHGQTWCPDLNLSGIASAAAMTTSTTGTAPDRLASIPPTRRNYLPGGSATSALRTNTAHSNHPYGRARSAMRPMTGNERARRCERPRTELEARHAHAKQAILAGLVIGTRLD